MKKITHILFFLFLSFGLKSQTNTDGSGFVPKYKHGVLYTISTTIGTKHTGYVVEETKDFIVLENRNTHEKFEISKSQIVVSNSKKNKNRYSEEILGDNPHAANYMVSGAAFLFEEGASVSNSHWLLLENVDYAITENWAVSATSFIFYPIGIGTKCAYQLNDLNYIGFSANIMGNLFSTSGSNVLFWGYNAFGKFTHGTPNKNLTVSTGLLALNNDLFSITSAKRFMNIPFVSAAYCNRFSEKFAFNSEIWLFPQTMVALSGVGFKYLHNEKIAWTFGCYTDIVSVNNTLKIDLKTIPIPYIGYSRKLH